MKMKIPKNLWKSFSFFLLFFSFLEINAQNKSITGTVTDTNNEALIGVTIQVQGTTKGTVTDYDGKYMIPDIPGDAKILVSYIGMQSQVIDVNNRSVIDIVLREDAEMLEDVVVVGYGIQKKASVTAAISSVDTKSLKQSSSANLSAALAGRLPGLTAMQTSGQPGNDVVNLYLRGAGTLNDASPLILIDGVPRNNISKIDPNEIETVSILKDASATAVFGVRGANGVIMITTRRGQPGKSELNVTVDHSMQKFLVQAVRATT
jgi:TonB-dependent SusC/RagA subfamily outer membrane receptor